MQVRRAVVCVGIITTILSVGCLISLGVGVWMSRQAVATNYFDDSSQLNFARMALLGSGRQLLLSIVLAHVTYRVWKYSQILKIAEQEYAANVGELVRFQNACWYAAAWLACLYLASMIGVAIIGYVM